MNPQSASDGILGRRILVVEDDPFIALEIEDLLRAAGYEVVGPAFNVARARALASSERLDGAVLDVNLSGEWVLPVAKGLAAASVPFVLVTGYGRGDSGGLFQGRAVIAKPFDADTFADQVTTALFPGGEKQR